jgi:hypothetical protein
VTFNPPPFVPAPVWAPAFDPVLKTWIGVCRDGPWQGLPLTAGSRFVSAPDGNEYVNDGTGLWNWLELHHEGK